MKSSASELGLRHVNKILKSGYSEGEESFT